MIQPITPGPRVMPLKTKPIPQFSGHTSKAPATTGTSFRAPQKSVLMGLLLSMAMPFVGPAPSKIAKAAVQNVKTAASENNEAHSVVEVTDANFENEVLNAKIPVLLKFGAPWCPPCNQMEPELEKLAQDKKYQGKVKVAHINIDNSPKTKKKYKISAIPDTYFFNREDANAKQNKAKEHWKNFHTKEELAAWIDKFL